MQRTNQSFTSLVTLGLAAGFATASVQGCDDNGVVGNLAEQCGLTCPDEGIAEGNASISGVASVDAFFSAVIGVRDAAANLEANVRAELLGLAALLEVDGAADLSTADLAAQVRANLEAKIQANVEGSLTVNYEPAKCEASVEVTAKAAAECDVMVDPGSVEAKCEGSCQIDASAQADCRAEGQLRCEGTAPSLQCTGSCTGTCRLDVAASCEGTCRGTCMGTCTAQDGNGNCEGKCDGMCQGTCELEAGGSCEGSCEGTCVWDPGDVDCEAGATAKCEVSAEANVECKGSCEGNVEPPEVSAECKAAVEAKAKASVECTPPRLDVSFQFAAGLDAQAQAEFRAFLESFKTRYAALLAATAKIEVVLDAITNSETGLLVSAQGAVRGAIQTTLDGDLDLKASIGLGCALDELENVGTALSSAQTSLEGSVSAVAEISAVIGG